MPVRPTLRCLREDLRLPVPPASTPLDQVDHPLLAKATEQFADPDTPHERIRAVDDVVLFKVKIGRWRGAAYSDDATEVHAWLVAAGIREDGSSEDFYTALHAQARAARQRFNADHDKPLTTDTHSHHLLPGPDDEDRYRLEAGTRLALRLDATVRDLTRGSLRDGHEHAADLAGFRLGILIRADHGHETYVAVRITGSVPANLTAVILARVPGCAPDGWFPEYALPERHLLPAEQAWSNLMDPKAAAHLLDD
ncbi:MULTISPECIES: hypothetical protein [Pseudofrankia]|uniref:hypothetical protein n=1 Tax=Pseudofrankia TaxID=2994363 RepID=UPI000234DB5C|nr:MULTISPECIES: hypothetical protein [Pseudofrankia]OHV34834.1 hypothetical protein BCD49_23185 [Pseudofrankia sp. EUN1h]